MPEDEVERCARTWMARKLICVRRTKYCRKLYELNERAVRRVELYRFRIASRDGAAAAMVDGKQES
jgi:hypothetical protein